MGSFLCPCGQGPLVPETGSFQPELTLRVVHSTAQNPSLASWVTRDEHRGRPARDDRKTFRVENQSKTRDLRAGFVAKLKADLGYQPPTETAEKAASAWPPSRRLPRLHSFHQMECRQSRSFAARRQAQGARRIERLRTKPGLANGPAKPGTESRPPSVGAGGREIRRTNGVRSKALTSSKRQSQFANGTRRPGQAITSVPCTGTDVCV